MLASQWLGLTYQNTQSKYVNIFTFTIGPRKQNTHLQTKMNTAHHKKWKMHCSLQQSFSLLCFGYDFSSLLTLLKLCLCHIGAHQCLHLWVCNELMEKDPLRAEKETHFSQKHCLFCACVVISQTLPYPFSFVPYPQQMDAFFMKSNPTEPSPVWTACSGVRAEPVWSPEPSEHIMFHLGFVRYFRWCISLMEGCCGSVRWVVAWFTVASVLLSECAYVMPHMCPFTVYLPTVSCSHSWLNIPCWERRWRGLLPSTSETERETQKNRWKSHGPCGESSDFVFVTSFCMD